MQIKNKVVLLTGGASGIGLAYAKELLRNGVDHLAILDLEKSNGEGPIQKLNAEFGPNRAVFIKCDVTKPQELEAAFKRTVSEFGGLDIVINNAGVLNDKDWENMISVNVNAVIRGTMLGLQYMGKDRGAKGGVIVNTSSVTALNPFVSCPVYNATKHAIVGFSRSFSMPYHYEKTGVRILIMCPGITDTPLISEAPKHFLDIIDTEDVENEMRAHSIQKVENVAHGMMHIIRSGQNGSVWVVENGKPVYEIQFPDRLAVRGSSPKEQR